MSTIFISHSSRDNAAAAELKRRLAEADYRSVFLDFDPADGLAVGSAWERKLYENLLGCQAVIVLCSRHSMASHWCFAEIALAKSLGKTVIPVLLEPRGELPGDGLLEALQSVDLTGARESQEEAYQRLWNGLRSAFQWDPSRSPYPGLLSFQEEDARVFFGRDEEIAVGLEKLRSLRYRRQPRLLLVLGASGSGKSSFVRAGLLPRLRQRAADWLIVPPFRPQGRPLKELGRALARAFRELPGAGGPSRREIVDRLYEMVAPDGSPEGLEDLVKDLRDAAGRSGATVLLVVDQTEELFGYAETGESALFLRLLSTVLGEPGDALMALCTMRSDFLGHLQQHPAALDLRFEDIKVGPVSNLAQVVEGPAEVAGIRLQAGLPAKMAADAVRADALPLLAFTLRELYERFGDGGELTLEQYERELGGLAGSVARAAESALAGGDPSPEQEEELARAFRRMVYLNEQDQYARQAAYWRDMPPGVHELLERFVQARLLVSRGQGDGRLLEVAHEALFRSWDRLRGWLDSDREFLLWHKRLRTGFAEWERTARDAGSLLVGPALAEGRTWLARRAADLEPEQRSFIEQSAAADDARRRREEEQQRLIRSRQLALQSEAQSDSDHELALLLAIEAGRAWESIEAERALRSALAHEGQTRALLLGHDDDVVRVRWSPDGGLLLTASLDGTARIWNPDSGEAVVVLEGHEAKVRHAEWSAAGDRILTASLDGSAGVWEAATGRRLARLTGHHGAPVHHAAWDADGRRVVTAGSDQRALVWDAVEGRELFALEGHDETVHFAAWSPRGEWIATAGFDMTARVWDAADGREVAVLRGHTRPIEHLGWSRDGRLLTASHDGLVRVWRPPAAKPCMPPLAGHRDWILRASWSPSDSMILTASRDGTARVWRLAEPLKWQALEGHHADVSDAVWSPDGALVATAGLDGTARVWRSGREVAKLTGHRQGVLSADWSPDGRRLATGGRDGTARIWSPPGDAGSSELKGHASIVWHGAWDPAGRRVATGGQDGRVVVWESATARALRRLDGHRADVFRVAWSPDGGRLASASGDGRIRIWSAVDGGLLHELAGHAGRVTALLWDAGGRHLVSAGYDGTIRRWDAEGGGEVARLDAHDGWIHHLAWSPDRGRLLSCGVDGVVRVWQGEPPSAALELAGHGSAAVCAAWSPDGGRIASASTDRTARLWDAASGEALQVLTGHRDWVLHLAWHPGGGRLATAGRDGRARIWDAASGALIAEARVRGALRQVRWSPDGERLLGAGDDGRARLWLPMQGLEAAVLEGHRGKLTGAAWSPRTDEILTTGHDGAARVFDARMGALLEAATSQAVRNLSHAEWERFLGGEYRETCPGRPVWPVPPKPVRLVAPRTPGPRDRPIRLGGIVLVDSPWGDQVATGMRVGARQKGVELDLRRHNFDFLQETRFIGEFIEAGVDALVLVPQREEDSVYMIQKAHEAGLVVVCIAIALNPRDTARYVSAFYESDNREIGYRTGAYLAQWLARRDRRQPKIGIVHSDRFPVGYRRGQGFRAALEDAGVAWQQVVSRQGILEDEIRRAAREIVDEHPEVDIIWTDNSENTVGTLRELAAMELPRPLHVFGTDINEYVAEALLDGRGIAQAVAGQVTVRMATEATMAAVDILRGEDRQHYHRIMESVLYTREDPEKVRRFLARQEAGDPGAAG